MAGVTFFKRTGYEHSWVDEPMTEAQVAPLLERIKKGFVKNSITYHNPEEVKQFEGMVAGSHKEESALLQVMEALLRPKAPYTNRDSLPIVREGSFSGGMDLPLILAVDPAAEARGGPFSGPDYIYGVAFLAVDPNAKEAILERARNITPKELADRINEIYRAENQQAMLEPSSKGVPVAEGFTKSGAGITRLG